MSLSDTLITNDNPTNIIFKDILRPANTQSLGSNFTSGTYRAVNITDQITSPGLQMFYVEVFNATSSGYGSSNQLPIPGSLGFIIAYVVLQDVSPSGRLSIAIPWIGNNNTTFRVLTSSTSVNNVTASFLVIGV
jgi:hypothetical protein